MSESIIADFKQVIRIIGRGQRAGRTLTQEEAYQAMKMLISGKVTAEQRGAFLMLLRVREETAEELAGFTQAFREVTCSVINGLDVDLDMGCYAGKRRHLPWFFLSALALAQRGKRIFLHGTSEPDSNRLYLADILPCLGFEVSDNAQSAQVMLERFNFCYLDLKSITPELHDIIQLREQFGLRSCANTLARMLNPAAAPASLQGVFHRHVDEKHRQTAALLGANKVLCFRGEGGEIEYNPERDLVTHHFDGDKQRCEDIPALADNWTVKPKHLDPYRLIQVWQGQTDDPYAQHAVVGTMALMLSVTEQLSWQQAFTKAQIMWQGRDKTWPVPTHNPASHEHSFDTQGKHYAH